MASLNKKKSDDKYTVYVKEEEEEEDPVNGCNSYKCMQDGSGAILRTGQRITSRNGEIFLMMQSDGNLVVFCRWEPLQKDLTGARPDPRVPDQLSH